MSVSPTIPGRAYRVLGMGLDFTALAPHPIDALCMGIDILIAQGAK